MLDDGSDANIVTTREIAERLKRSRFTVHAWTTYDSFPWPVGTRKARRGPPADVYCFADVEAWKATRKQGRQPGPRKKSTK